MENYLHELDDKLIAFCQRAAAPFMRVSLFVVYFWFGILKIFGTSPASPLVANLLERTLPFVTFEQFIIFFSLFEMLIGVLFLFPKMDRVVLPLFAIHMVMTAMPLILLPQITWQSAFVPTLEGQYIIKNLLLIAAAIAIASRVRPLKQR